MVRLKRIVTIILASALFLTGCSQLPAQVAARQEEELNREYNAEEMYLILASRKGEIRDVYTDEIFNVKMDEHGTVYEDSFEEMIKDYITKMYVMTRMCEESGIEINTTDLRAIEERAGKYMEDFDTSGNGYDITLDDAAQILADIYLIDMLKEKIIDEAGVEVSESDARVMDVIRITLDDAESANNVLTEVSGENADFAAIARRNSVDSEIDLKIGKGDTEPSIEEIVFNLEDGEISPIIQLNGRYYIFKCVTGYDEEATAARREQMTQQRKDDSIARKYDEFFEAHEYELPEDEWKQAVSMCRENSQCPDIFNY